MKLSRKVIVPQLAFRKVKEVVEIARDIALIDYCLRHRDDKNE